MKKLSVVFLSSLVLMLLTSCDFFQNSRSTVSLQDSIFIQKIKTLEDANLLYQKSRELKNDSIHAKSLYKLMAFYYQKDWELFNQYRFEFFQNQRLHSFFKDFAKVSHYSALYFNKFSHRDSAFYYYYKTYKLYEKAHYTKGMGKTIYNIAIIQKNLQDYEGSEQNSTRALTLYAEIKDEEGIADVYNNLGLVYDNQRKFSESQIYHIKALELRQKEPEKKIKSLNNIGLSYQKQKDYDEALNFFSRGLLDTFNIQKESKEVYTMLLDNYGYTLFLKNGVHQSALDSLNKAYYIRKQTEDYEGLIMSAIHLSEYHYAEKNLQKAVVFANLVETYSVNAKNYTDYIRNSQFLLSLFDESTSSKKRDWLHYKKDSINKDNEQQKDILNRIWLKIDEKDEQIEEKDDTISQLIVFLAVAILLILLGSTVHFLNRRKKNLLQKKFAQGFQKYLIKKYDLTKENIDFWESWVLGFNQKELSEKLFISEDAVKSRRKSLKKRIQKIQKNEGIYTQVMGANLYNREKELYQEILHKKD